MAVDPNINPFGLIGQNNLSMNQGNNQTPSVALPNGELRGDNDNSFLSEARAHRVLNRNQDRLLSSGWSNLRVVNQDGQYRVYGTPPQAQPLGLFNQITNTQTSVANQNPFEQTTGAGGLTPQVLQHTPVQLAALQGTMEQPAIITEQPTIQTGGNPVGDKPIVPTTIDAADKIRYALPADMVALLAQRYSIPQQYGTNFLDAANPGNNPLGSVIGAGALQGGIDQLYTALKRNQIANDFSKLTGNTITRDANGNWYMMQGDMPVALSPAQAWQLTLAKSRNTYDTRRTLQGDVNYAYDINKTITGLPQGGGATTSGSSAGASANANQLQSQVQQSLGSARQAMRQ